MADNTRGVTLALASSVFIGVSFIIKKKGLIRSRRSGSSAGNGGYGYLQEPLWWVGLTTMIFGEIANFTAYAFAPAILVTPLGALSVIISAVLASLILKEKLAFLGKLGCGLCIVGSTIIVLNAPEEMPITSVEQITIMMATNFAFQFYCAAVLAAVLILMYHYQPLIGTTNVMVYVTICSLVGSISVIGVKGLSIGLKLTLEGRNQLDKGSFWGFVVLVTVSIITQMNYLNKALDTFNTAVVTPIYYVFFTTSTIVSSAILFNGWGGAMVIKDIHSETGDKVGMTLCGDGYGAPEFVTVIGGFVTIISGVFLLHHSREVDEKAATSGGILSGSQSTPDMTALGGWDEEEGIQMATLADPLLREDGNPSPPNRASSSTTRSHHRARGSGGGGIQV